MVDKTDRIQKLRALANSTHSENEAATALVEAQRLLQQPEPVGEPQNVVIKLRSTDDGYVAHCKFLESDPGITAARCSSREEALRIIKSAVFTAVGHLTKFREPSFLFGITFTVENE